MKPHDELPPEENMEELDELLAAQSGAPDSSELAERLLASPDLRLERVLGRLPEPQVPAGLAARVLDGVAGQREAERAEQRRKTFRLLPGGLRTSLISLAAALLLFLGLRALLHSPDVPNRFGDGTPTAFDDSVASEELLASLDLLENWELLTSDDLDLLLVELDDVAELMIELDGGSSTDPEQG